MSPHVIFHIADFDNERDMITEIVGRNLDKKLDSYLKKFTKNDDEIRVEVTLTRDMKKGEKARSTFSGKVMLSVAGKTFRSERKEFETIEDLINHLFDHIKTQIGSK